MHMVALYTVWYNFARTQCAPIFAGMAAGVTGPLWSMKDLAEMVDASAPKPGPRGPYKRQAAGKVA